MSTSNPDLIELAREYFRRLDAGSPELLALFAEDSEIYFPKYGIGRGRDQLLEMVMGLGGAIESVEHDTSTYRMTRAGDTVFVEGTTKGVLKSGERWAAGETPGGRFCNVFEFRGGLISRLAVYLDPDYGGRDEAGFLWGRSGRTW